MSEPAVPFNQQTGRRFVRAVKEFLRSEVRWRALGLFALLIGLLFAINGLTATLSWPTQTPQPSEVNMIVPNYTPEDLQKLPLRAIVALAARCARRVESLSFLPDGHPEMDRCQTAIDGAIRLAEDFARGSPCRDVPSVIREVEACRAIAQGELVRETALGAVVWAAHAAAAAMEGLGLRDEPAEVNVMGTRQPNPFPRLANVAADLAARDAFTAAVDAACAAGFADKFIEGAMHDYQALLKLGLGRYPEAGQPIDPSPAGPLGEL